MRLLRALLIPPHRQDQQAAMRTSQVLALLGGVLHVFVLLALTIRSAQIARALFPFDRSLANEWIHLLFFVPGDGDTLPHFLLEIEEEIAVDLDNEFFHTGFAHRSSASPVGMLFTISEARQHVHGAVRNYFALPQVALQPFVVAGMEDPTRGGVNTPMPELTVQVSNQTDTVTTKYEITGRNASDWPPPLQENGSDEHDTRAFFDHLDAMQLRFVVGIKAAKVDPSVLEVPELQDELTQGIKEWLVQWEVVFIYDLASQGHLEVAMTYALLPPIRAEDLGRLTHKAVPPIFFDQSTVFDGLLVFMLVGYQATMFAAKWLKVRDASSILHYNSVGHRSSWSSRLWQDMKTDFWFWFSLVLNTLTLICVVQAWPDTYDLVLHDSLCLLFALCCAMQWMSLVQYLQLNTRFHMLGLTLQRGLPRVAQFLVGVLPIFVGYVLFGTIMFGAKVPRFQSAGATATTLFSVANGDEIHDTFNAVAFTPWIGQIYIYSYMILFSYVVLMVCIGIIEDAFFSAVFPASWPSDSPATSSSSDHNSYQHQQPDAFYEPAPPDVVT